MSAGRARARTHRKSSRISFSFSRFFRMMVRSPIICSAWLFRLWGSADGRWSWAVRANESVAPLARRNSHRAPCMGAGTGSRSSDRPSSGSDIRRPFSVSWIAHTIGSISHIDHIGPLIEIQCHRKTRERRAGRRAMMTFGVFSHPAPIINWCWC